MVYIPHDKFARRAKTEGYRARSAYKLLYLQRKFKILKKGQRVLDLGAAPGSWTQVASAIVGEKGLIVAVDIVPMKPLNVPQVKVFQKDIQDADIIDFLKAEEPLGFDMALSDVAPNTTGIKERDQAVSHELASRALQVAIQVLKKGGSLAIKVFEGPDTPQLIKEAQQNFSVVKLVKPEASTKGSKEIYLLARSFQ